MNLGDEHDYNMPNALFLADVLERSAQTHTQANAAAELRRLHDANENLLIAHAARADKLEKMEEQLHALRGMLKQIEHCTYDPMAAALVRVAIAKAEEET